MGWCLGGVVAFPGRASKIPNSAGYAARSRRDRELLRGATVFYEDYAIDARQLRGARHETQNIGHWPYLSSWACFQAPAAGSSKESQMH
ncbi:hypothetical protein BDV19DRAFT_354991 [Aspergillus venezuelensis]